EGEPRRADRGWSDDIRGGRQAIRGDRRRPLAVHVRVAGRTEAEMNSVAVRFAFSILLAVAAARAVSAQVDTKPPVPDADQRKPGPYTLGADSLPQEGVPKGRLEGPFLFKSRVLAGTVRRYWVYV